MNRFLKGAMILTLAGIIVKVIGAFSKVLIARILGGEGIGLYMMAYPIYQIIVSISAHIYYLYFFCGSYSCSHIYYDCRETC